MISCFTFFISFSHSVFIVPRLLEGHVTFSNIPVAAKISWRPVSFEKCHFGSTERGKNRAHWP